MKKQIKWSKQEDNSYISSDERFIIEPIYRGSGYPNTAIWKARGISAPKRKRVRPSRFQVKDSQHNPNRPFTIGTLSECKSAVDRRLRVGIPKRAPNPLEKRFGL